MTQHVWQPLVGEEEAVPIRAAIRAIACDLVSRQTQYAPTDDSLGAALFFAYLFETFDEEEWTNASTTYLDQAIEMLSENEMGPSLHGGFSGIAWVSEHLRKNPLNEDAEDEDPNSEVDEALLNAVATEPWTGSYDLIQGLVGIGVYFLERLPRSRATRGLHEIVLRLKELSENQDNGGHLWLTKPEHLPPWQRELFPNGHYNLGVAHGIPAVVGLLAAISGAKIGGETARSLLCSAVQGFVCKGLSEDKGFIYPSAITRDGLAYPSRLAWCYGDAGIAACLLAAARAIDDSKLEEAALEAGRAAARRTLAGAQIGDPDLCHGAAGLLQIFNRLFQATNEDIFRDAAKFWLAATLAFREPGAWIGGFWGRWPDAAPLGPLKKVPSRGLLEGASGVGLALLASCSGVVPDWDRLLMISLRQFGSSELQTCEGQSFGPLSS